MPGGGEQLARDHEGGGDQWFARDSLIIIKKDQGISYEFFIVFKKHQTKVYPGIYCFMGLCRVDL